MSQAASKVQAIYTAINHRNVAKAVALIDEQCCYEDLNFSATFMGQAAVEGLFAESCQSVPKALRYGLS